MPTSIIKLFVLFSFLCLLALAGCGTKYSKEIAHLDSIKVCLLKVQSQLNEIDTARLLAITDDVTGKLSFIQSNFTDTADLKLAQTLDAYNRVGKSIGLLLKQLDTMKVHILTDTTSSSNLKHDLKYNIPLKEKVIDYCKAEEKELERINKSFDVIKQETDKQIRKSDSLKVIVDQFILEIKTMQLEAKTK